MTTPLILTSTEKAAIEALDAALEKAFKDGTESPAATPFLDPFEKYDSTVMTKEDSRLKKLVKSIFKTVVAAMLKADGLKEVMVPTPATPPVAGTFTATYATPEGGSGTLTFTDGILTGHTETPPP